MKMLKMPFVLFCLLAYTWVFSLPAQGQAFQPLQAGGDATNVGLLVLGFLVCPFAIGYAAEDTQIQSSFLAFQKTWIQKLNKEGRYGEKSMRVDRSAEDRSLFVARYDEVKEPGACRIKKTGQTACPYVGVMRYEVWTCTAKGKTQDEAKRGPFDCQPQSEITEIFRYAGGMWVY